MRPKRIPLFPLDVVLFPGVALPLHIFEPRYKEMIGLCLATKLEFGVVLAHKQGVATIGCTAAIVHLVKQYADGKMDLLTRGQIPFQIQEIFDNKAYYEAAIEYLDEPGSSAEASKELTELYEQCCWLLFRRAPESASAKRGFSPAYAMAASLPLELDAKQALLEMRDEAGRQALLCKQLEALLPQLIQLNERRARARGNGHSLN